MLPILLSAGVFLLTLLAMGAGAMALAPPGTRDERVALLLGRAAGVERKPVKDRGGDLANEIANRLNLRRWLALDTARERLQQAGRRGPHAEAQFLVARALFPILLGGVAAVYLFVFDIFELQPAFNVLLAVFAVYAGFKLPELALSSEIKKRRRKIREAFPDALDLMVMMAESGMGIDQTLRRIAEEIEPRCKELAEELQITLTERSFLADPKMAFDNLGARTEIREIRATAIVLIQSQDHGTPLGPAFRALAKEGRETRMHEAIAKAASLAALMPAPVLIFFLIPLMLISLFPAAIELMEWR